ncbi:MAG: phosphodiester glycosidase family protein [Patescibacteria group bacterium]
MNSYSKRTLDYLEQVNIQSWFDIGLFLDQLKHDKPIRKVEEPSSLGDLKKRLRKGVAFATYVTGLDGVSIEMYKYSSAIRELLGQETPVHWLVGEVDPRVGYFKNRPGTILQVIPEMGGFEKWGEPYRLLYHSKLKRGGKEYNELPLTIWQETKVLTKKLLDYIEQNNIELFLAANVESNPGNISLTLSLIIISELYNIHVIASNHDYYWEGGSADRKPNEKKGPRDHFFKNSKLGEVFSVIQTIYPWDSPKWLHSNINTTQSKDLVKKIGINPFHVSEMTTSINTNVFRCLNIKEKQRTWQKVKLLFNEFEQISHPERLDTKISQEKPILISLNVKEHYDLDNTSVFLQPTRIIERKNIEKDFDIIESLLKRTQWAKSTKKILLIIAGPIASGSDEYYQYILAKIRRLYTRLGKNGARVSIGFLFGKNFDYTFESQELQPLRINELYGISELIFLLSDLETRGLPIIESAATRVPLVIKRFYPEEVYAEVLGLNDPPNRRMQVLELPDKISDDFIQEIYRTLTNPLTKKAMVDHNHRVVSQRYSIPALTKNFNSLIEKLWLLERKHSVHTDRANRALVYVLQITSNKKDMDCLIYNRTRTYIPGIVKYRFLSQVKSIIDPTYFRVEEKEIRRRLFGYAMDIMPEGISEYKKEEFFGAIDKLFTITKGRYRIQLDHSFDYRYRTREIFRWRELTELGMKGAIERLSEMIFSSIKETKERELALNKINSALLENITVNPENDFADKYRLISDYYDNLSKSQINLTKPINSSGLIVKPAITVDDWDLFQERVVKRPQTLAIFPGSVGDVVFELLAYDQILANWNKISLDYHITFIATTKRFGCGTTTSDLHKVFSQGRVAHPNIHRAYLAGKITIVDSGTRYVGINLEQLSEKARQALLLVKENDGHILAKGEDLFYGLDLIDINSFRFGTIRHPYSEAIFNEHSGDGFFQFIPAGLRPFFGFPLMVETPTEFSQSLRQIDLSDKSVLNQLKEYLDKHGTSLRDAISSLHAEKTMVKKRLSGKYRDGYAWTGIAVKLKKEKKSFDLQIATSKENKTLPVLARLFEKRTARKIILGWNGGYILNSELVGKLGLPEIFIGTPLGLIISRGRILSLPLFNRPAFAVTKRGKMIIEKISFNFSGKFVFKNGQTIEWDKNNINKADLDSRVCVFTPLSGFETVSTKNRTLIILGGRKVIKIVHSTASDTAEPLFPAGITFSIPKGNGLDVTKIKVGDEVTFDIDFTSPWNRVTEAMEAGPLLVEGGVPDLNLAKEGWMLKHSIATQAARRDRDNERGPKIGCGITKKGDIVCVVVESRFRESVGATYKELSKILVNEGVVIAMGFDPGGSASLWFENGVVNIVPYSKTYNTLPISGKSSPRPIESAVLIGLK